MRLRLFLIMSSILALVVVVTVFAADRLDMGGSGSDQVVAPPDGTVGETGSDDTTSTSGVVPAPGQVHVAGTVTSVLLTGAVLQPREIPTPLTVQSQRGFGNGGQITSVEVEGRPSTISWDGGRPLVLSSGGPLVIDPADVALVGDGLLLVLGGGAHALTPGPYQLDTPVAVGTEGIATPRDSVAFTAVEGTLLEARGDASIILGDGAHHLTGPGRVLLGGTLELTDTDGTTTTTDALTTDEGAFDLTLTRADGTWHVSGVVDAPPAQQP